MKLPFITAVAVAAAVCVPGVTAQTVVNLHFTQNPLFEVSTHEVTAAIPDGASTLTLGADLAVAGGSGTYTYLWTDGAGDELGRDATLQVSAPGVYNLTVSDQCDCSHDVVFDVTTAGIDAAEADGIAIVVSGRTLWIEGGEARQATVFTTGGRMVLLETPAAPSSSVSLSGLEQGIYVAQVVLTDGRVVIRKVQIN